MGPASGSSVVTAAPPPEPTQPKKHLDSKLVSDAGVGPIIATTTAREVASLFPGKPAKVEHHEAEDYKFDVIAVDDLAITTEDPGLFKVTITGSAWATVEGISTASTIADVVATYPDLTCTRAHYVPNPEDFTEALICTTAKYARLSFYVDPAVVAKPGKVAPAAIAKQKLQMIIWMARVTSP